MFSGAAVSPPNDTAELSQVAASSRLASTTAQRIFHFVVILNWAEGFAMLFAYDVEVLLANLLPILPANEIRFEN